MSKFEIEIVNYLDKEELVAEIYYESFQWAEIFRKKECILIRFFSYPHKECWEFSCEEALKIIEQAKMKLLIRSNQGNFLEKMTIQDPEQTNRQAEKILKEIINHPDKKIVHEQLERFGEVIGIYDPQGRGARYSTSGEFIGFLET